MGSLYSEKLLDHFRNPRHPGELPPPARTAEVTNPACGDVLRLSARVEDGIVSEAAFLARGCTASIAAGSALTTLMLGRPPATLRGLDAAAVEAELGGLPEASKHAAALAIDALRALLRLLE